MSGVKHTPGPWERLEASKALPANHPIQSDIRQALGLRVEIDA